MRIKHSKFRNTGLIFELLVKQIAVDTLNNKDSAAVKIMRENFTGKSILGKEYKLYEFITKNKGVKQSKAEAIVSTIIEVSRRLSQPALKQAKYKLIADIKEAYNIEEFFGMQVRDYKALAALYCLMEAQNNADIVNPQMLVNNKTTILEHLTKEPQSEENVKDTLIEEYSKYDKDLRLLTMKMLLERFNETYKDLLPEQKRVLKEFITSANSNRRLLTVVNEEMEKLAGTIAKLANKVNNEVVKIKLDEISKSIKPLTAKDKITDAHLVNLMQYYDLVNELSNL